MLIFNFDCRMIAQVIGWEVTSLQTISLNSDWLQSLTQRSATRLRCIFMPVGNQLAVLLIVFYTNPMLPSTHSAKSLLVEDFLNFHIKSMRFWLDSELMWNRLKESAVLFTDLSQLSLCYHKLQEIGIWTQFNGKHIANSNQSFFF